jgi:hypothetical protein
MNRKCFRNAITAAVLLAAFVGQGTWALAGTTGGLTGTVVDADTSAPIAGADVRAVSPSQSASTRTDAAGHFTFLSLAPDTYTVNVEKEGYQPISFPGQTVFADTVQTVSIRLPKALKTIARVSATAAGALVKSGTTADVYSINSATLQSVSALGGGGSLNQAYSAIATVPGAYVIPNQSGYYETINIRGGDYDQVGYEFDGVPVNRSFDNYASSSASSLGNAEVQVYTGANPANSEGQGLAGYINQVIKTGTYPGYFNGSLGIGTPTFYHRASAEAGGASPDRLFSYYAGIAGSDQAYRYVNNDNGSEYDNWLGPPLGMVGPPFATNYAPGWSLYYGGTGPTYYPLGPAANYANFSSIYSRDAVINFHFGIPHRHDGGRDDIQVLYDNEMLRNQQYLSGSDVYSPFCGLVGVPGGEACMNYINGESLAVFGVVPPDTPVPVTYLNTYTWSCGNTVGKTFDAATLNGLTNCVTQYIAPNAVNAGTSANPNVIPANARDNSYNDTVVTKLQYTKSFGSNAFLRLYGYTFYSDWFLNGQYASSFCYFVCFDAPDYELSTHTRGISLAFEDQLNPQHLLSIQGNYTTATIVRDNNGFYNVNGNEAVVVNSADPYGGYCYAPGTLPGVVNCHDNRVALGPGFSVPDVSPASGASCAVPGHPEFGTACTYMIAENGLNGTYSGTRPNFYGASLTDQFRPTDHLLLNLGVRLDSFNFVGQNTTVPPLGGSAAARQFWFNAYNLDNCIDNATGAVSENPTPAAPCPAGTHAADLANVPSQQFTYNIWQPRLSGTYTISPDNVIRFSYGRYTEAPNTAFEQYNTRQEDLADYLGSHFLAFGRNTPGYPIRPPTSINYDISWEHRFKGTDLSFKVTPFLRQTQDQVQQFFLNPIQGFVSGLNVGSQRSQGVEFQLQKGDFARNGFSALFSFAYTNSYIKYGPIAAGSAGTTVLGGINTAIQTYNAYTSACVAHPTNPNCGTTSTGVAAGPCYTLATATTPGAPVGYASGTTCPAGTIANPYWTAAVQPIIDPHQNFPTYDTFPAALGSPGTAEGFGSPYVASLVLNYKHDKIAATPSFQFEGGGKYGIPISSAGIDPTTCAATLPGTTRYDATTCTGVVDIPDPFTGIYDGLGAFTQPNEFIMNFQLSYDVSPRISITGVFANIFNYCFGGTKEPWTVNDGNLCSYDNVLGTVYPVAPYGTPGAIVNPPGFPGSVIQPFRKYPYEPTFGPALVSAGNQSFKQPFQFFITANVKL